MSEARTPVARLGVSLGLCIALTYSSNQEVSAITFDMIKQKSADSRRR